MSKGEENIKKMVKMLKTGKQNLNVAHYKKKEIRKHCLKFLHN